MKEVNRRYADIVKTNYEENVVSGREAVAYMDASTAVYHGVPVACLYLPKLFTPEVYACLEKAAGTIYKILEKVIARYIEDTAYRKLFPFQKELEELILTEAHYPCALPISRLDIFLNEEDLSFQFCEFNADGASAMNEDREICSALRRTDAFSRMQEEYTLYPFEFFDSWVSEFMKIYRSYDRAVEQPRVVITDFMESATPNEFIEFQKAFQKAGYDTEICEIRDLRYEDGELKTPDGKRVDAVYRRAVTRDIMEHIGEVAPFIQAARDNAACIIGHFKTQVIHNKSIFRILRLPETLCFLTEEEAEYVLEHIPETLPLKSGEFDRAAVLKDKDKWIIKPEDLYGSRGVYAGVDCDAQTWERAVTEATDRDYLLQRYCRPYRSPNLDFNGEERPQFQLYNNITGMFVYNGHLQGLYSRAGLLGTISSYSEGRTLASMLAEEN